MKLKNEFAFDISEWAEDADIGPDNLAYNLHLWNLDCERYPSSIFVRQGQLGPLLRSPNSIALDSKGTRYLHIKRFGINLKIKVTL